LNDDVSGEVIRTKHLIHHRADAVDIFIADLHEEMAGRWLPERSQRSLLGRRTFYQIKT
jgi:hypothetical protein